MVKFLACGERGPGFDSRSRRFDLRDFLFQILDMTEISLTDVKKQPTKQNVQRYINRAIARGVAFRKMILIPKPLVTFHF